MLLLFGLAWAEPPPVDPALRSCAQQRCGDRCIAWTEVCPASVQRSMAEMADADRKRALAASLCGAPPTEPRSPATLEQQLLLGTAVGILCGTEQATDPDACRQDVQHLPDTVVVPAPACGERSPVATTPAAPAPAKTR